MITRSIGSKPAHAAPAPSTRVFDLSKFTLRSLSADLWPGAACFSVEGSLQEFAFPTLTFSISLRPDNPSAGKFFIVARGNSAAGIDDVERMALPPEKQAMRAFLRGADQNRRDVVYLSALLNEDLDGQKSYLDIQKPVAFRSLPSTLGRRRGRGTSGASVSGRSSTAAWRK